MNNHISNTNASGVPYAATLLPVMEGFEDHYSRLTNFVVSDTTAAHAQMKFGGGIVHVSCIYPGSGPGNNSVMIDIIGSQDGITWVVEHRNVTIKPGECANSGGKATDYPVRFLYWSFEVTKFPSDAPGNEMIFISAITRPTSPQLTEGSNELY